VDHNDAGLAWEILQRYRDPATAEFDAVLASAGLPDEVARALRFWQRESVANVKQYAAEALPVVLGVVADAQRDVAEATYAAAAARAAAAPPREPGVSPWAVPRAGVITLPDTAPTPEIPGSLEERRRTVAARLAQQG
jgi:hypothetical protein